MTRRLLENETIVEGYCEETTEEYKERKKAGKPAPKYSYTATKAARCRVHSTNKSKGRKA